MWRQGAAARQCCNVACPTVCYYILINTQNAQTVEKTTYLNKHAVAGAWSARWGRGSEDSGLLVDCVWIAATLKTHQQLLQREK